MEASQNGALPRLGVQLHGFCWKLVVNLGTDIGI